MPLDLVKRSILLVDIVDYSELAGHDQVTAIEKLTAVTSTALKTIFESQEIPGSVQCLPTGDGMFVVLPVGVEVLRLAAAIHQAYESDSACLKVAINEGYVFPVTDITRRKNIAGAGINLAARLESCCSGGHILVTDSIVRDLTQADERLRPHFQGPFAFRVKHDRIMKAWSYASMGVFGNPQEPTANRVAEDIDYVPLRERLRSRGVAPRLPLQDPEFAHGLSGSLLFPDMFQLTAILGYAGIAPEHLVVATRPSVDAYLPPHVLTARQDIVVRGANRAKAFLMSFTPAVLDQGIMDFEVAIGDYRTFLAIRERMPTLHQAIRSRELDPTKFCARLNVQVAVLTSDNKLILAKRRAGLDDDPETWSILGESIDGEKDRDADGTVRPEMTVLRALWEDDELGIAEPMARTARIRFVALARKASNLLTDLVAVAEFPHLIGAQVVDSFRAGEHTHVDAVDFTLERCLESLVISGRYEGPGGAESGAQVNDFSRYGIFSALCYRFGYHEVVGRI